MRSKAMKRAERSARAVRHGPEILQFIQNDKTRARLAHAAELGSPPVTAISSDLYELVGKKDAKLPPIKQFTGLCVRAVLEEEGFELVQTGVRVSNDPIFRTGSVYQRSQKHETEPASDLLARFIQCLNNDEVARALMLLQRRRQN